MKLLICIFALVATAMSESNQELFRSSSEKFSGDFFQEVAKTKSGESFVTSPFSLMPALAQIGMAATGDSRDEILKSIGLPNDDAIKEVFTDVTKQLRSVKGVELKLANRIYVREGENLNEEFEAVSRDVFNSDVKNIEFSKNIEAAEEINSWVEDKTNHRIKNLVSPDSLNALTAAVLVNAIYFKGIWSKPFNKDQTREQDFYVSKNETIKVPMMQKSENFKYGESKELDAQLLELPYEGDQSSLLIVLPKERDGIRSLVEKLKDTSVLTNAVNNMYYNEVQLQIPKFKIETTTDLGSVLQNMNVKKIFSPDEAHLYNLLKTGSDVYVSKATQKAYIEINEEGAEAAAANVFIMLGATFSETKPLPKIFNVDKPFYFELRSNNLPLFSGIAMQPSY